MLPEVPSGLSLAGFLLRPTLRLIGQFLGHSQKGHCTRSLICQPSGSLPAQFTPHAHWAASVRPAYEVLPLHICALIGKLLSEALPQSTISALIGQFLGNTQEGDCSCIMIGHQFKVSAYKTHLSHSLDSVCNAHPRGPFTGL